MRKPALLFLLAAGAAALPAQSRPTHSAAARAAASSKLPAGIPVVHGIVKSAFSLRYEDYKIGAGPLAEPNKVYHVLYTGYLAKTGAIFDSSADNRPPLMKDGKPVIGADGKPELAPPQPLVFPQGFGRLIPGFDQGFEGMHVGGKRRLFVPWQLAYGTRAIPEHGPDHPGIPPKSDLIFDIELVSVTDMPAMPTRPMIMPPHPGAVPPSAHPAAPAAPKQPPTANAPTAATPPQPK